MGFDLSQNASSQPYFFRGVGGSQVNKLALVADTKF